MERSEQEQKVIEMLRQQNRILRKEVKTLQTEVKKNVEKPPKQMKAKLDTSTNYEKMIANATIVLQQAKRDKAVYEKRVAKHDNESNAEQLRSDISKYKEEIAELQKKNNEIKFWQINQEKDLINDMKPAKRFSELKEELKFYHGKNQQIQARLDKVNRSMSQATTRASDIESKVAAMPPVKIARKSSEGAEIRMAQKNVVKSLQRDYNVVSRSFRSISNRYRRQINDIESSLKSIQNTERTLLSKINGRADQTKRAHSTMAFYERKMPSTNRSPYQSTDL